MFGIGAPGSDAKVTKIFKRSGIGKIELESASAGDVVSIAGKSPVHRHIYTVFVMAFAVNSSLSVSDAESKQASV